MVGELERLDYDYLRRIRVSRHSLEIVFLLKKHRYHWNGS